MAHDIEGPTVLVTYTDCECPWQTKYCEENHTKTALIPADVLECYRVDAGDGE
jgi:hypothetical protein